VFFVRRQLRDGSRPRVVLGRYPELGLAEARDRARAVLGDMVGGFDPNAASRIERAKRAAERQRAAATVPQPTVKQRLEEWSAFKEPGWSIRHAYEVGRVIRKEIIPALGIKPLQATTRADWTALALAKKKPAMASLILRVCSTFLNHAEAAGWIEAPLLPRKVSALAPAPAARERILNDDELRRIWSSSGQLSPRARTLIRLLILTGARVDEVNGISAGEIDAKAGLWRLPGSRSKNRKPHTLPLCTPCLTELARCDTAIKFRGLSKMKSALDRLSGVRNWRLHDLRRTMRSGLSALQVPRAVAEAALNHAKPGLVGVYDQHDFVPEVIAAVRLWQGHVASLVEPEPPPLRLAAG
jgi:integrase